MMAPALLQKPYRPPKATVGDQIYCEHHGADVTVAGQTDAPIRWPAYAGLTGRLSPILTGDLARAVRVEGIEWQVNHPPGVLTMLVTARFDYSAGVFGLGYPYSGEGLEVSFNANEEDDLYELAEHFSRKKVYRLMGGFCSIRIHNVVIERTAKMAWEN